MHLDRVLCALLCLLVVLSGGEATLSKKDKKGKKKKEQVHPICLYYYQTARQSCDNKKNWGQGVVTCMWLVEAFAIVT